jgi:hypothetical protein
MSDLFGPSETLPAITLWQPWASLIFSGHKRCETRSFAPPFKYVGQRIAIHAAAALPSAKHFSEELCELCYDAFGCGWNFSLPRGAILGTVTLGGFYPTEKVGFIAPDEKVAGDWSNGRYAWQLLDVEALPSPVPAKGKQGWWRAALAHQTAEERDGH